MRYYGSLQIVQGSFCFSCSQPKRIQVFGTWRGSDFWFSIKQKTFLTTTAIPTMVEAHPQTVTDICHSCLEAWMGTYGCLCEASSRSPVRNDPPSCWQYYLQMDGLGEESGLAQEHAPLRWPAYVHNCLANFGQPWRIIPASDLLIKSAEASTLRLPPLLLLPCPASSLPTGVDPKIPNKLLAC